MHAAANQIKLPHHNLGDGDHELLVVLPPEHPLRPPLGWQGAERRLPPREQCLSDQPVVAQRGARHERLLRVHVSIAMLPDRDKIEPLRVLHHREHRRQRTSGEPLRLVGGAHVSQQLEERAAHIEPDAR